MDTSQHRVNQTDAKILFTFLLTGRSQTRNSYSSPITEKRQLCLPSSTISRANHDVGGDYPYKHPETIYAKGSRRNLVIMNGRMRVNAIQEKVEEQILSSCAPVY